MSAYGYDSQRRRRAQRAARRAAGRRRFAFWFRVLLVAGLLGLAAFAIVDSRIEPGRGERRVQFVDTPPTTYATTTLPPR